MEHHVWVVSGLCIVVLCMLAAMGLHLKYSIQPQRTAELRRTAPQRKMDKVA